MYERKYNKLLTKKLKRLRKKDPKHFDIVYKKIKWIREHPEHSFKFLHYDMKKTMRIHIGSFVLLFRIDHEKNIVYFDDYDHHDNVYP